MIIEMYKNISQQAHGYNKCYVGGFSLGIRITI